MEISILVAKIVALLYLATGLSALSGRITFGKMITEFEKSHSLTFITGFIALVFGMLLVQYHNVWTANWTVLITVIGWASLVKGVLFIAFPQIISAFKGWFKNVQGWGFFLILIGVLFGYFGFIW